MSYECFLFSFWTKPFSLLKVNFLVSESEVDFLSLLLMNCLQPLPYWGPLHVFEGFWFQHFAFALWICCVQVFTSFRPLQVKHLGLFTGYLEQLKSHYLVVIHQVFMNFDFVFP